MEDQKIIELIRSRKHDKVFTALYSYFPAIKKMIIANGGRSEDAEDVYQDALIVFYKKASTEEFELSSSINTYLYSICKYMWSDKLKKRQHKTELSFENQEMNLPELIADFEEEEHLKLSERVITELGERCRELLIMFYFQSMKLKDIAASMGYNSENTAKNQKYKCLEAAKSKLKALKASI